VNDNALTVKPQSGVCDAFVGLSPSLFARAARSACQTQHSGYETDGALELPMGQLIQIYEARIRDHLGEMVRGTVEHTLNAILNAEADRLCGAER